MAIAKSALGNRMWCRDSLVMTITASVKTDNSVVKVEKALFAWVYAQANKCSLTNHLATPNFQFRT